MKFKNIDCYFRNSRASKCSILETNISNSQICNNNCPFGKTIDTIIKDEAKCYNRLIDIKSPLLSDYKSIITGKKYDAKFDYKEYAIKKHRA